MESASIDWEKFWTILKSHRDKKWGLIPLLQKVQESFGYIPPETIEAIAEELNLYPSQVQGVITFYSGFTQKPKGKCVLKVCRGTACHVKGGQSILKILKKNLDLDEGETSADYQFTLETVACLGACFLAPTMMVNRNYFGKLSPVKISSIVDQHRKDKGDE